MKELLITVGTFTTIGALAMLGLNCNVTKNTETDVEETTTTWETEEELETVAYGAFVIDVHGEDWIVITNDYVEQYIPEGVSVDEYMEQVNDSYRAKGYSEIKYIYEPAGTFRMLY